MLHPAVPPHIGLKPMSTTPAAVVSSISADVSADIAKLKADLAIAKTDVAAAVAKVEAFDAKQSTWLAAHAHAVVTGALVIAVAYILHVIL
jgi:hypothetical protein